MKEFRQMYETRLLIAEVFKHYELEAANEEYEREKSLAEQQFEAKGLELKECLLNDLQDKRKAYDQYRHNMDLSSGSMSLWVMGNHGLLGDLKLAMGKPWLLYI